MAVSKSPTRARSARNTLAPRPVRSVAHRDDLHSEWHLARNPSEIAVTEFEFALLRIAAAFERWQAECLGTVLDQRLGSVCNAILHVVRLKDRPKSQAEIARLLNRDDIANVQYSMRKLQQAGLIERSPSGPRKSVAYRVTRRGRRVSDAYAHLRAQVLIPRVPLQGDGAARISAAQQSLDVMRAVYEQAALMLATHRGADRGHDAP